MLEPTSPMSLSQSNLSLCALDPSFITPAVVLSLHYHQFSPLLEHFFEHKTGGITPISKTNPTPLTSHPVSSYYPMCQSGFSQGNITAESDVGIAGIRPHTIGGGPGEVKVQRRKLEKPEKIINQASWSTCGWINWSLLRNLRSRTHPATGMALRRGMGGEVYGKMRLLCSSHTCSSAATCLVGGPGAPVDGRVNSLEAELNRQRSEDKSISHAEVLQVLMDAASLPPPKSWASSSFDKL